MRTILLFCCLTCAVVSAVSCSRSPEPTVDLKASPAAIDAGGSVTLTWGSENADSVRIEPGIGEVAEAGYRPVSPTSSITYTATATGPGGTATKSVEITVNTLSISDLFASKMKTVYFDLDRADIRPDQLDGLKTAAHFLGQNTGIQFSIEGHTDERGSQRYNIGLGDRRANAVYEFLIGQGVAATRIQTMSYGEERPVCTQADESCWSQNRRVQYTLR